MIRLALLNMYLAVAVVTLCATPAWPCSTFCLDDPDCPVFGKNYDWEVDCGMLIVNKRGVRKRATGTRTPAEWTSRYGSLTFNQYGRELPSGGMNEAGLVIELMWLDETTYPEPDERPSIDNLQWIQYQLDNHATVAGVIASDSGIRITQRGRARVHYLVADRSGRCASIEFIGGALVHHDGATMPVNVLTNSTYDQSIDFLRKHSGFGGSAPPPDDLSSLGRFVTAADRLRRFDAESENTIDYAFDILDGVAQGQYTKWSIVYDIRHGVVHFRTHEVRERRRVDLASFDFDCSTPVLVLDLNAELSGNVSDAFSEYTEGANRRMIGEAFHKTSFLSGVPPTVLDALAAYPNTMTCEHGTNGN